MYNAAIETTHAVTKLAIFFKLCLVIRGYIFLQPCYLHEAVSYTSVGSYVVTTLAIFFKLCLVIRGYIFLQPCYLHEAVSYTSVGSYVVTTLAIFFKLCLVIRGYIFLQPCYLHEAVSYTSVGSLWTTASFPYLGDGCTQLQTVRLWYFSRTSGVTLGDYGRSVVRSR